ncbi:Wadjet anti-phage system protein JetD domain-containing protein [Micromonospora sp. NPDC005171]|uniref:Wadjet anti-phage system protein JetD domain-containing protein n=1 Tax=Micromonospora sp. NPDC005171 TaxID=3156866 RepID=UPI0033ADECE7
MTPATTLAAALQARLLAHAIDAGRTRASLTTLLTMQATIEAHAATRPGARQRLSNAIDELVKQAAVETPRSRHLWDHAALPPLPRWVVIIADISGKVPPIDMSTTSWVPIISRWIGTWLRTCKPPTALRAALQQINSWLLEHLGEQPAILAREERSLSIFNDEKTLARIEPSSIFAPGRLKPQDLAYERPVAPLRAARLAAGGDLLIVENQATFDSAWRALRQSPGPFAAIAFGNGWEAAQAEPVIALADHLQLRAAPERIVYAGDLDIDGLDIPQTLAANLNALGFPEPQPLRAAYNTMLDPSRDRTGRPNAPAPEELARQAVKWLQDDQRDRAHRLLVNGQRIAQEVLDRKWWVTTEL